MPATLEAGISYEQRRFQLRIIRIRKMRRTAGLVYYTQIHSRCHCGMSSVPTGRRTAVHHRSAMAQQQLDTVPRTCNV
eukprot:1395389-Amorphochlora_amoeboformis.AAC.2